MKEQAAGLYAQTMAERGFVALAFDPSYNGDSGGEPRRSSSPEIFTEDFSAAVDFLGTRPFLDRDRIGVIGICGSGGFALSAAQVDRRIRAVGTSVMYDISLAHAHGFKDAMCEDQRNAVLDQIGAQRWREFEGARVALTPRGAPETVDDSTDPIAREFYEYYSTPEANTRTRSPQFTMVSGMSFMNFRSSPTSGRSRPDRSCSSSASTRTPGTSPRTPTRPPRNPRSCTSFPVPGTSTSTTRST